MSSLLLRFGQCVRVAGFLVAAVAAVTATPASAEYYFTESGAKKVVRDAVYKQYGYSRYATSAACRPQGEDSADSSYKYHRWVCGWAVSAYDRCDDGSDLISGRMLIVGRSGRGAYSFKVLKGATCGD